MEFTIYDLDSGSQQTVSVEKLEVLIGSGPDCDIVLRGGGISERQARYYIISHHRYLDVYEGASVLVCGKIEALPPPESMKCVEVKPPGWRSRIDGFSFKIGRYIIQPVKSKQLSEVFVKMLKRNR
jgi:hypothetical protein